MTEKMAGSPITSQKLTTSTAAIYGMLRRRMLEYQDPDSGASMADVFGGIANAWFYVIRAPDPTKPDFPYAVMRLMNQRSETGRIGRMTADLEVQLFGRPWTTLPDIQASADLAVAAMTAFVDITNGLTFSRQWQREEMPMPTEPADSETCTIRLLFPLVLWPTVLTSLAVNSPA